MFVCPECGAAHPVAGHCGNDGTALAPVGEDLLLGTTIGVYRVARLIGIGGMGRVYKGVHPTIGSRVAIKVLSRECSDRRDLVERFFSEAKAVNLIRHESIVNVLDLAVLPDGRPYIIMEYLDGCPLTDVIETSAARHRSLPLGGLARLAVEVLDALSAAHGKGIVHRDLKPDNIFVTPSGRPKVLDFGIAKLSDASAGSSTRTGSLLGTPHYMSPEQAAGRPVDHRADLYAMGVILFEGATGTKPFHADSLFDLLRKHVEAPPPPARSLRPDVPPLLEQVILVALAKSADARFSSANAMSLALQQATAQLPADQWTPITANTASLGGGTPATGGWAPTTPATWGGARAAAATDPSTPAGHGMPGAAGPAASPPRVASRRRRWGALGALLLVAGGVTAAVLAGGGEPAASDPGPAQVAPAQVAPAQVAPAQVAPASAPEPGPVEAAHATERDHGRAPGPADVAEAPPAPSDRLADQLDTAAKDLRKRLAPLKRLGKVAPPRDGGTMVESPLVTAPPTNDGWFERHRVTPPFNLKQLAVERYIDWAIAEAKQNVPDAQLTWISVDGVYASGRADLSLPSSGDHGSIDLRFISPSRSKRDANVPRGVKVKRTCEFRIMADPRGAEIYDMSSFGNCKSKPIPRPRCSLARVWKKALAQHPDVGDAVASVVYTTNIASHKIVWMFSIKDDGGSLVSAQYPDDC